MSENSKSTKTAARCALVAIASCLLSVASAAQEVPLKDGPKWCDEYDASYPPDARSYGSLQQGPVALGPNEEEARRLITAFDARYGWYLNERKQDTTAALEEFIHYVIEEKPLDDPIKKTYETVGLFLLNVSVDEGKDHFEKKKEAATRSPASIIVEGGKAAFKLRKDWLEYWKQEQILEARDQVRNMISFVQRIPGVGDADWRNPILWPPALRERANPNHQGALSHRQAEWVCEFVRRTTLGTLDVSGKGGRDLITPNRIKFALIREWLSSGTSGFVGHLRIDAPTIDDRMTAFVTFQEGKSKISFVSTHLGKNLAAELKFILGSNCDGAGCWVPDPCNPRTSTLDEELLGMRLSAADVASRSTELSGVDPYCSRERGPEPSFMTMTTTTEVSDSGSQLKLRRVGPTDSVFDLGIPIEFSMGVSKFYSKDQTILFLPGTNPNAHTPWLSFGMAQHVADSVLKSASVFRIDQIDSGLRR